MFMPGRKKKSIGKFRGSRSCGTGNVKNKRGSGNRGGVGGGGLHKHKFSWITAYDPDHFGSKGMRRRSKRMAELHLYEIDSRASKGKLENKEGKPFISFEGKVLATGEIRHAVNVKALAWSERAEEKIKAAGGSITRIGE